MSQRRFGQWAVQDIFAARAGVDLNRLGTQFGRLSADPKETHDLILIDVDHSPDERLGKSDGSFYSAEGLRNAKRHLSPGGVLGVWSRAQNNAFHETLCEVFAHVRIETVTFENEIIDQENTNWLFFAWQVSP